MNKNILVNNLSVVEKIKNDIDREILIVVLSFLSLVALAQVRINLPFTPVPITGQTLGVILIALLVERKLSVSTMLLYILAGSLGAPVYAGFKSGFVLNTATGGYIIGFIFASLICGYFVEKGYTKSTFKLIMVIILANLIIYTLGMLQLSLFIPLNKVLYAGLLPFIPGDIVKMIIVFVILKSGWTIVKK